MLLAETTGASHRRTAREAVETVLRIVFLFPTTHAVMHAAQILDTAGIQHEVIPRPKGVDADCGIAVAVRPEQREAALAALRDAGREPSQVLHLEKPGFPGRR